MTLRDIRFEKSYTSPKDDIVRDFLVPALKEAVNYDRSVGYFSSSMLLSLSVGITGLLKNGGRIRIICSPELSEDDVEAINSGYKDRESLQLYVVDVLMKDFLLPKDEIEKERFNILSHLISSNRMDIKIAIPKSGSNHGLFHQKTGIIYDANDNYVAFNGSMNDSYNAYYKNFESIDVFTSYGPDYDRANEKRNNFESLWSNSEDLFVVMDFPEDLKGVIKQYEKETIDYDIDRKTEFLNKKELPNIPSYFKLRDYQERAIKAWKDNNYIGIFDMATGSGKTYTSIAGTVSLLKEINYNLAIIICCPYQHLVSQWEKDLVQFGFDCIVGYSGSPQKKWKEKFKNAVFNYTHEVIDYLCLVTTNQSFATKFVQEQIDMLKEKSVLLIVDEAHNFGTRRLLNTLNERFTYRLALSATLERKYDEFGTNVLYDYFQKKCIVFDLKDAIDSGALVQYKYYPIPVYLTDEELNDYNNLSRELLKFIKKKPDGTIEYREGAERILIKRARVVAGAENKVNKLKEEIQPFRDKDHILVYCGSTTVFDYDYKEGKASDSEVRQIERVSKMLINECDMVVGRFTSQENAKQRSKIIQDFAEGKTLQALVAIRCLDEGVDIPSIETAFILASSTNPKEYVQRRGRVLRRSQGKLYATIVDFITLPRDLDLIAETDDTEFDLSLLKREITRLEDFAHLSLNPSDSEELLNRIEDAYGIYRSELL